ncbi:MAG: AP2 domain-containing protein [Defluviitaleaceae bacterium]|nr:AP2 domain-containing protein [Defluviitaleaceae bacterium]
MSINAEHLSCVGNVYNGIEILSFTGRKSVGKKSIKMRVMCDAKCHCDKIFNTDFQNLRGGGIKSCGCQRKGNHKHGNTRNKIYNSWRGMKERCLNPNNMHYENYGGRGIRICDEWLNASNFIAWALKNGYKEGLTVDRINNDGNYEPSNCRWTTHGEQAKNRRETKNKTSGVCGIYRDARDKSVRYRPYIFANGKNIWLGGYATLDEAIAVRESAEKKYWNKE